MVPAAARPTETCCSLEFPTAVLMIQQNYLLFFKSAEATKWRYDVHTLCGVSRTPGGPCQKQQCFALPCQDFSSDLFPLECWSPRQENPSAKNSFREPVARTVKSPEILVLRPITQMWLSGPSPKPLLGWLDRPAGVFVLLRVLSLGEILPP